MQNIHMKKLSMPSLHWLQKIQRNQILQFPRLLPKQAVQDRPFIKNILKISMKLNTKNQIIRINTVFKDYSSIKKAIILPRIYHD